MDTTNNYNKRIVCSASASHSLTRRLNLPPGARLAGVWRSLTAVIVYYTWRCSFSQLIHYSACCCCWLPAALIQHLPSFHHFCHHRALQLHHLHQSWDHWTMTEVRGNFSFQFCTVMWCNIIMAYNSVTTVACMANSYVQYACTHWMISNKKSQSACMLSAWLYILHVNLLMV